MDRKIRQFTLDIIPAFEEPHHIDFVLECLKTGTVGDNHVELGEISAVLGHNGFQNCLFTRSAPACVGLALEILRGVDALALIGCKAGGIVLENGCDRLNRKRIGGSQGDGDVLLIADAEIAFSNGNECRGCALGRLYDGDI